MPGALIHGICRCACSESTSVYLCLYDPAVSPTTSRSCTSRRSFATLAFLSRLTHTPPSCSRRRSRSNNLPPPTQPQLRIPSLMISTHIPILMNIPRLPRIHSLLHVPGCCHRLLLLILPFSLSFALTLHFSLEQGFRGPSAGFGALLRLDSACVFEVDFCGGGV